MMRNAITVFNEWAEKNKDTGMEKGHSASVEEMLKHALKEREKIGDFFSFLDLGCGNGGVVRKVAKNNLCEKAMGVDGSKKMIAKARAIKPYCEYFLANIDSLKTSQKFDLIHIHSIGTYGTFALIPILFNTVFILTPWGSDIIFGSKKYINNHENIMTH